MQWYDTNTESRMIKFTKITSVSNILPTCLKELNWWCNKTKMLNDNANNAVKVLQKAGALTIYSTASIFRTGWGRRRCGSFAVGQMTGRERCGGIDIFIGRFTFANIICSLFIAWICNFSRYILKFAKKSIIDHVNAENILTSCKTNMASFLICFFEILLLSRVELRRMEWVLVFVVADCDRRLFWFPARARLSCSLRNAAILAFISGSSQISSLIRIKFL